MHPFWGVAVASLLDHAIYHADIDKPALVPERGLEAAVRAFARIIDDVNTLDLSELKGLPAKSQ
jgi:hypothetical protein